MNRSVAWFTTALMMLPQAAWAQGASAAPTINPQAPLAPGEVMAQVAASGAVRSKPDLAIFRVTVVGQAATYAAARAAADAAARELTAKLVSVGLEHAAVRALPNAGMARVGFIGNEAYQDDGDAPGASAVLAAAMARQRRGATTMLEVQVTDMGKLGAVRALLEAQKGASTPVPTLSLHDDAAPRRAAVAVAVGKARQETDSYAAALAMQVALVVRVYDQAVTASQAQDFAQMISLMNGGGDDQVVTETRMGMGMEVVLAPR